MMSESDKTAIAAHLYITLRRTASRIIDVEWLAKNDEYAKEVIRLARQTGSDELTHYAGLYEELVFGVPAAPIEPVKPAQPAKPVMSERAALLADVAAEEANPVEEEEVDPNRYIGHLR